MTPRARFRRSLTLWLGLAFLGTYWLVVPVTDNNTLAEWLRIGMLCFGATAAFRQLRAFRRMWIEETEKSAQELILGYTLVMTGSASAAGWLLLWRMSGFPVWMVQSAVNGFWLWMILLGVIFIMTAPREPRFEPPRSDWALLGFGALLTLIMGLVFVHVRPDVGPLVAWLHGWLAF